MSLIMKLSGAALIIAATTVFGFLKANNYTGREKDIKFYINALSEISRKIRFGEPDTARIVGGIYGGSEYYYVNLPFSVTLKKSYLGVKEEELINEFFLGLGSLDTESEIKRCEKYIAELSVFLADAQTKKQQNARLCRMLGVFAGVAAVIVLI